MAKPTAKALEKLELNWVFPSKFRFENSATAQVSNRTKGSRGITVECPREAFPLVSARLYGIIPVKMNSIEGSKMAAQCIWMRWKLSGLGLGLCSSHFLINISVVFVTNRSLRLFYRAQIKGNGYNNFSHFQLNRIKEQLINRLSVTRWLEIIAAIIYKLLELLDLKCVDLQLNFFSSIIALQVILIDLHFNPNSFHFYFTFCLHLHIDKTRQNLTTGKCRRTVEQTTSNSNLCSTIRSH